jgi:hypothetical protein
MKVYHASKFIIDSKYTLQLIQPDEMREISVRTKGCAIDYDTPFIIYFTRLQVILCLY